MDKCVRNILLSKFQHLAQNPAAPLCSLTDAHTLHTKPLTYLTTHKLDICYVSQTSALVWRCQGAEAGELL